ncbi:MAG TPA: carboxypeptidase-like regulatory domain-containing protein [Polyangia bacterium]|jgi:hypothetical protein
MLAASALAVAAAACSSTTPGALGDLSGYVVDEVALAPVVGGDVRVADRFATTGPAGEFFVAQLPTGSQRLTVTAPGYVPFTATVAVQPGPNDVGQSHGKARDRSAFPCPSASPSRPG